MAFFQAVLFYVLVSSAVLYAQVPRMMRQGDMLETTTQMNETELNVTEINEPDTTENSGFILEHLNISNRVNKSMAATEYPPCNNTAEPCGFRIYETPSKRIIEEVIYCVCPKGLFCIFEREDLSQRNYIHYCRNATEPEPEQPATTEEPAVFVARRVGSLRHYDL